MAGEMWERWMRIRFSFYLVASSYIFSNKLYSFMGGCDSQDGVTAVEGTREVT